MTLATERSPALTLESEPEIGKTAMIEKTARTGEIAEAGKIARTAKTAMTVKAAYFNGHVRPRTPGPAGP